MNIALVRPISTVWAALTRRVATACCAALVLAYPFSAQQSAPPNTAQQPAPQTASAPHAQVTLPQEASDITEADLRKMLVGKPLYLRGGYLDNTLSFNEYGRLIGHSVQGPYTLNVIQIDKVSISKHKITLEGARFGLHFLGQLASEDTSSAYDRIRITPKKKVVKITIDREMVVKPSKEKESKIGKKSAGGEKNEMKQDRKQSAATAAEQTQPVPPKAASEPEEMSEADQLKASIAATPENERPAEPKSVTTTTSPRHATKVLKDAIDNVFAHELDERLIDSMPDFWKLYYQAAAAKTDYRPKDPSILRQNTVDQKARLLTAFEPDSNEFAQAAGIVGMAQYHAVVKPDGTVGEVVISRPIGFGLDENAVAAIHKAKFQPAMNDGKPVAVMLNLDVQFRIYSKRTDVHALPESTDKPAEPVLPGPYSLPRP